VTIAHPLGGIAAERAPIAAAAVEDEFGFGVRDKALDVPLEDALAEMARLGRVAGRPFGILADIEQDGAGVGREAGAGLRQGNLPDTGLGVIHDLQEAGRVVHEPRR